MNATKITYGYTCGRCGNEVHAARASLGQYAVDTLCGCANQAGLGVGHIWTAVACPAYRTLNGADCTCNNAPR